MRWFRIDWSWGSSNDSNRLSSSDGPVSSSSSSHSPLIPPTSSNLSSSVSSSSSCFSNISFMSISSNEPFILLKSRDRVRESIEVKGPYHIVQVSRIGQWKERLLRHGCYFFWIKGLNTELQLHRHTCCASEFRDTEEAYSHPHREIDTWPASSVSWDLMQWTEAYKGRLVFEV